MLSRRATLALGLLAGCASPPGPRPAGTVQRPQLTQAVAQSFRRERVLALAGRPGAWVRDDWDPLSDRWIAGPHRPPFQYLVDAASADGTRVFASVQAAVNRAHHDIMNGTQSAPRVNIGIAPGRYVETVYIPQARAPITLWGLGAAPSDVRIEHRIDAAMPRADFRALQGPIYDAEGMHPNIAAMYRQCARETTTPTSCTAVVSVASHGFQARHLSIANSDTASGGSNVRQAVAFKSEGADRVHLEQVHLLGHQDTLYLRSPAADATVRTYLHRCVVAGDIDFVFGPATAFFERCEIRWVGARRGLVGGWIAAPSTHMNVPYGFVFDQCDFTSDATAVPASVHLARQWFTGARCSPYGDLGSQCAIVANDAPAQPTALRRITLEQVGKMAVLHSRLGAHLRVDDPWAAWQTDRTHRAYRPVQRDSEEAWRHLLEAGHDPASLGWARPSPPQPFLTEFNNRPLDPA